MCTQLLDTKTDTPNVTIFEKLGFTAAGVIPGYALDVWEKLRESTLLYKHLL